MGALQQLLDRGVDVNVKIDAQSALLLSASIFAAVVAANLISKR